MTAKERLKDLEKGKQIGFESSKPKKKKEKTLTRKATYTITMSNFFSHVFELILSINNIDETKYLSKKHGVQKRDIRLNKKFKRLSGLDWEHSSEIGSFDFNGKLATVFLFHILYELSKFSEARELSSSSFAQVKVEEESHRVQKVKEFIRANYREEMRLEQLSELVGMAPTAFSRFFKLRTGKNLAEYIVDVRLGVAARQLIDSNEPVSQICYTCGFNTLTNFNRLFKKRKGCSPTEFREKYAKTKVIV